MPFRMLTTQAELDEHLVPVLKANGSEIPSPGCYVAAVEFDEAGQVIGYQMLQNAIFFEGLWARHHAVHLRSLFNMALEYTEKTLGVSNPLTMTRNDVQGQRIGRAAERLGFKRKEWNVYRREN